MAGCNRAAAAALTSTQSYRHYIDTDRGPEQQSTHSIAPVLPQGSGGMEEIWPKESHHQAHQGDGDEGSGFVPSISDTHFLFLHFHLIGDAIPSHHS